MNNLILGVSNRSVSVALYRTVCDTSINESGTSKPKSESCEYRSQQNACVANRDGVASHDVESIGGINQTWRPELISVDGENTAAKLVWIGTAGHIAI